MLDEPAAPRAAHTAVAVYKAANFRSAALRCHLGFESVAPRSAAAVACDADEQGMSRPLCAHSLPAT